MKIKLRNEYSKQKIKKSPEKIESIDKNFKSNQIIFSRKFQEWGKYEDNDRRYYLHMIFRFYLNEYHKILVRNNLVIEYPSYQSKWKRCGNFECCFTLRILQRNINLIFNKQFYT